MISKKLQKFLYTYTYKIVYEGKKLMVENKHKRNHKLKINLLIHNHTN